MATVIGIYDELEGGFQYRAWRPQRAENVKILEFFIKKEQGWQVYGKDVEGNIYGCCLSRYLNYKDAKRRLNNLRERSDVRFNKIFKNFTHLRYE